MFSKLKKEKKRYFFYLQEQKSFFINGYQTGHQIFPPKTPHAPTQPEIAIMNVIDPIAQLIFSLTIKLWGQVRLETTKFLKLEVNISFICKTRCVWLHLPSLEP